MSLLDDTSALAACGELRPALRALYLSTLSALDRAGLIEYEASKTNGQYLRAMPRSELRRLFADFTRVFDHKWYGHEPTTLEDFQRCHGLAERIARGGEP